LKRNLIALDLLLAVLIGTGAWRLRVRQIETLAWQNAFLAAQVTKPAPPVISIPGAPELLQAMHYMQIATQLPLSKDRNPTVIEDPPPPPPPRPKYPRFYGMMNLGAGVRVILSAPGGQRSFAVGDVVGEFKLLDVTKTGLVFEWNGKEWTATWDEIKDTGGGAQPEPQRAAAPTPASSASVTSVTSVTSVASGAQNRPGAETGEGIRGCSAGDSSPAGAVVDGYRKVVVRTPFGASCRWEKVQ
jgi:hypothetical protein